MVAKWHASFSLLLATLSAFLVGSLHVHALSKNEAGKIDWHLPRMGVPQISSQTPAHYLVPRFHRLIRPDQNVADKTQTAIYYTSQSNTIGALNPRNGEIVWRQNLEQDDPVVLFQQASDVAFSLSGANVRMWHGLHGSLLWETHLHDASHGVVPELDFPGVDATVIRVGDGVGDLLTVSNAKTVQRLDAEHGRQVWKWEPLDEAHPSLVFRVIAVKDKIYALSLSKTSSSYSITVYTLSRTGQLLSTHNIDASVQSAKDVVVLPWNPLPNLAPAPSPGAFVAWIDKDGTVKGAPLDPSDQKTALAQTISSTVSTSPFTKLYDVGLGDRGLLVAQRSDGIAQVLRVNEFGRFYSMWTFDDIAHDAIYAGAYDRSGQAYVNRVFFSRNQHFLHIHIFWADSKSVSGEGQVTGSSLPWDHDLHGNVLACPFEVSPVSMYQVMSRIVLVTSSGSVRMIQDDQHMWINEEGLSQTEAVVLVDLPERKLTALQGGAAALDREGFVTRVIRHVISLKHLAEYLFHFAKRFATGSHDSLDQLASVVVSSEPDSSTAITLRPPVKGERGKKGKNANQPPQTVTSKPTCLAPRVNTNATLFTDSFGFRKLIVAATKRGKIYAFDSLVHTVAGRNSKQPTFIWEKSLVGFGQGEGEPEPSVHVKLMSLVRPLSSDGRTPLLNVVVEEINDQGMALTRVIELNPLTGEMAHDESKAGIPLFVGTVQDAFLLPIKDADTKQQALGIIDQRNQLHLYPDSISVATAFAPIADSFFFSVTSQGETNDVIAGFATKRATATLHRANQVWQLPLAEGERIVSVVSHSHKDHIASLGRVLGDRSTLYKYLNPHVQLITTVTPTVSEPKAHLYLVDSITGSVVWEAQLTDVDLSHGVQAHLAENWLAYSYAVRTPAEGLSTRLVSVELYEQPEADQTWSWKGNFSSFTGDSTNPSASLLPLSYSQSFLLPYGVRSLGTTTTKFGISLKNLLIATDQGTMVALPRRMLDPRRPLGKPNAAEAEEYMIPYSPMIPAEPKWVISHMYPIEKIDKMVTWPALLESTSMVYAFGSDSFFTRVTPSGQFDILQESFNKPQLLLTIAALSLGIVITRPMVRGRSLAARW